MRLSALQRRLDRVAARLPDSRAPCLTCHRMTFQVCRADACFPPDTCPTCGRVIPYRRVIAVN